MQTHTFEPFRPGGRICAAPVAVGVYPDTEQQPCGLTAEAPVHREETGEEYDARREAERPDPINVVRGIVAAYVPNGEESYGIAMRYLDEIKAQRASASASVTLHTSNTPAEECTGISDRTAAALTALAELRRTLDTGGRMPNRDKAMTERLDIVEQALRRGGRRSPDTARLLRDLRTVSIEHAVACYRRGVADASGKSEIALRHQQAARGLNERMHRLIKEIRDSTA